VDAITVAHALQAAARIRLAGWRGRRTSGINRGARNAGVTGRADGSTITALIAGLAGNASALRAIGSVLVGAVVVARAGSHSVGDVDIDRAGAHIKHARIDRTGLTSLRRRIQSRCAIHGAHRNGHIFTGIDGRGEIDEETVDLRWRGRAVYPSPLPLQSVGMVRIPRAAIDA